LTIVIRTRSWLLLALAGLLLSAGACSSNDRNADGATLEVQGLVVEVQQGEGDRVAGFVLLGDDGRMYTFRAADATDSRGRQLSASHMRQDAALASRFTVKYREQGSALAAIEADHADGH
jgi:hypothetical protein